MTRYVVGHQQPDTDTVVSAIAYARLQQEQGEDVEARVAGELNPETRYVLEYFDVEAPPVLDDAAGEDIVLVDHNEYSQAVDGMEDARVVRVIDHHRLGDVETADPIHVWMEPVGSTATILAAIYEVDGVAIDETTAGLLLSGLLSDTVVLRSPTTTDRDREVAAELAERAGVDYEEYGKELLAQKSKLGELSPREMVLGDFKEFEFDDRTVGIGQVETVDPEQVLQQKEDVLAAMQDIVADRGYAFLTLLVTDLLEEESTAFFVGDGQEVYEQALDTTVEDGAAFLPGVMSRKKQVVPPLEDAFT